MRYSADSLDYSSLIREGGALAAPSGGKTVKVAILADCAIQQLTTLLKVLAARNGVALDVYEGGYDSIDLEILNPESSLYAFGPQYLIVLMSSEKLKNRLYDSADRKVFAADTIERIESLWGAFGALSSATIVQSTFVLPSERAFGNYELKVADSVGAIFTEINYRLAAEARSAKNVLFNDVDFLAASIGRRQWLDARLWNMAKMPCRLEHMPLLAQSLLDTVLAATGHVRQMRRPRSRQHAVGRRHRRRRPRRHRARGVRRRRGVRRLSEVHSRTEAPRDHPRRGQQERTRQRHPAVQASIRSWSLKEEDISAFVANWDNKADNIRLVQKTLNIGFDSFVFLDDNPFERNIVREYVARRRRPGIARGPVSRIWRHWPA